MNRAPDGVLQAPTRYTRDPHIPPRDLFQHHGTYRFQVRDLYAPGPSIFGLVTPEDCPGTFQNWTGRRRLGVRRDLDPTLQGYWVYLVGEESHNSFRLTRTWINQWKRDIQGTLTALRGDRHGARHRHMTPELWEHLTNWMLAGCPAQTRG